MATWNLLLKYYFIITVIHSRNIYVRNCLLHLSGSSRAVIGQFDGPVSTVLTSHELDLKFTLSSLKKEQEFKKVRKIVLLTSIFEPHSKIDTDPCVLFLFYLWAMFFIGKL